MGVLLLFLEKMYKKCCNYCTVSQGVIKLSLIIIPQAERGITVYPTVADSVTLALIDERIQYALPLGLQGCLKY